MPVQSRLSSGYHPLELLCEDAWYEIILYLERDPADMISIGATCTFFQDFLEGNTIARRDSGKGACSLELITPFLVQYLVTQDDDGDDDGEKPIYNFRLVCKRLSQAVDKMFDVQDRLVRYQNLNLFPKLIPPFSVEWPEQDSYEYRTFKLYEFDSGVKAMDYIDELNCFEDELKAIRARNGSVKIAVQRLQLSLPYYDEEEEDLQDLSCQRTYQFFRNFADDIKSVTFDLVLIDRSFDHFQFIRNVLVSLPHLSILCLMKNNGVIGVGQLSGLMDNLLPLPPAPMFEKLTLDEIEMPMGLLGHLSNAYGGTLRELTCDNISSQENGDVNLDEALREENGNYEFAALLQFDFFPESLVLPTRMTTPNLKLLHLNLEGRRIDIGHLIRLLLHFSSVSKIRLSIGKNIVDHPDTAIRELEQHEGRHVNLKLLEVHSDGLFMSNIPLSFFMRLFPNMEQFSPIGYAPESQFAWNGGPIDPDLRRLLSHTFEQSGLWEEALNLKVVSWKHSFNGPYKCFRPAPAPQQ